MSNSSNSKSYVTYLNNISSDINNYGFLLTACVGVPFNLVNILIYGLLMKNKTNMGFLGICQSVLDIITLLYLYLIPRSAQVFGVNVSNTSDFNCRFLNYMRRIFLHASSWMTVMITFDRFMFIMYGHGNRFNFMKKKVYLTAIMLGVLVIIGILDIPNLLYYLSKSCTATADITLIVNIGTILLRTYLPFIFMIVFNILMIQKIFKKNRLLKSTTLARREYQFTLAVMAYDLYFFFFNFPLSVFYILNTVNTYLGPFKSDALNSAIYSLVSAITVNLANFIQTFSILSYLIFNKLFRREFFTLIERIFGIRFSARVNPDQTLTLAHTTAM
jgi:hypothetical protein